MSEKETVKVVYAGLRNCMDGVHRLWFILNPENDSELTDRKLLFVKKKSKSVFHTAYIGDIHSIEMEGDACTPKTYFGRWQVHKNLSDWKLENQQVELSISGKNDGKKVNIGDLTLSEIKEKMDKTIGHTKRTALLMSIVEYIS